jgi:hypothetical protein
MILFFKKTKIPQRHVKIVTGILKKYLILMRRVYKYEIVFKL